MDLKNFIRLFLGKPLLPYQSKIAEMIETLPKGYRLKVYPWDKKGRQIYAEKNGKWYRYCGDGKWKRLP